MKVVLQQKILRANDEVAAEVRETLLSAGVLALNLMGAPGSGKTSVIEATVKELGLADQCLVIEGDLATSIDTERLGRSGIKAVQANTGRGCHLIADTVKRALQEADLSGVELVFIENVGNLVCPAAYDLGETLRVIVSSVAEGDDKPAKYPPIFRDAAAVVLNKSDLVGPVDFDTDRFRRDLHSISPQIRLFEVSCKTKAGIQAWAKWLNAKLT
jgi:hydrogenase nickel incorporation protein HypB